MATSANAHLGAIPAVSAADPFSGSPSHTSLRYATFDTDNFSLYSSSSPSHAKRALEAHLSDTDRRIQDASRLGTTLLQQRKELFARLHDVEEVQKGNEMPEDLRKKLAELEKEYNEVGKESARAFLPKSRAIVGETPDARSSAVLSASGRESPTKVTAPSRRQRNQPSNRVHDIEFATEISTSLLAQVRQLQAALAEKDDALRNTTSARAQLEADLAAMAQKLKRLDESEQRYKDETWNLETKVQEMEAGLKDSVDKESRLAQTLTSVQSEKLGAQRELDSLRASHDKLHEDHAQAKKQQENDLYGLRRDAAYHETEKQTLQRKIEDLTTQNTELAKAVSYRWNQPKLVSDQELVGGDEDGDEADMTPEHSEPVSPVKGTPRHGMLESETLKSSLNHAHRMIQNLKNNIHREKTEKIELKRMLQDARDELESRRSEGSSAAANAAKKRKGEAESIKFKKPARPLGANRGSTTEILDDEPEWEDHDSEVTPSKSRSMPATGVDGAAAATFGATEFERDVPESSDAFETANERDTTTETEAFETGNERLAGEDSDELTETETGPDRSGTIKREISPLPGGKAGDRSSFLSTASASGDEDDIVRTPVQNQHPKYRLRMGRGNRRSNRATGLMTDSPSNDSPASSTGTPRPQGQSLGDELDAMDDDDIEATPSKLSESFVATPESRRHSSLTGSEHAERHAVKDNAPKTSGEITGSSSPRSDSEEPQTEYERGTVASRIAYKSALKPVSMVDAGVMTEPWEPEKDVIIQKQTLADRAGEVVGGALAGFGLGRIGKTNATHDEDATEPREETEIRHEVHATNGALDSTSKNLTEAEAGSLAGGDGLLAKTPATSEAARDARQQQASQALLKSEKVENGSLGPVTSGSGSSPAIEDSGAVPQQMPVIALQHSGIISQETAPAAPPRLLYVDKSSDAPIRISTDGDSRIRPAVPIAVAALAAATTTAATLETESSKQNRRLNSQDHVQPTVAPDALESMPVVPQRSLHRFNDVHMNSEAAPGVPEVNKTIIPGTEGAQPGASFFTGGGPPPLSRSRSTSLPPREEAENASSATNVEPKVLGAVKGHGNGEARLPLKELTPNAVQQKSSIVGDKPVPVTKPLQIRKPMADEGSQTVVAGHEIESMLRDKARVPSAATQATDSVSPMRPNTPSGDSTRRSVDNHAIIESPGSSRGSKRPSSFTSIRSKNTIAMPPPLPEDHTLKIAAASSQRDSATGGSMGPPTMPASAYKQLNRPKTPVERAGERAMSRDGTTPRPPRARDSKGQVQNPSMVSRRTSVSSFASELDERFNITRGQVMYPADIEPATDPRMIQAITQTMIGEYLWKYTRKPGRSEKSNTRHRRFFWVHPYTRTLYWSEQDPSTAGKSMLKAKSVAIEAVRVITDDNAYPPGLHRKSLLVITPGREIFFTAPTGQRHETWFNALSYLLLRSEQEKEEAEDIFNEEDLDEFNPGFSVRRSISRIAGRDRSRGRKSLSSYNSRTTRNSSPQHLEPGSSLAKRQSLAAQPKSTTASIPKPGAATAGSRTSTNWETNDNSVSNRFSSIASKFRPSSSRRGSVSSRRGRSSTSLRRRDGENGEIYDASVVGDSAEDLRAVIERQEMESDRLENVRACCDGKHDVGSLSRKSRHASLGSRLAGHTHTHEHPHAVAKSDPSAEI